VAVLLFKRPKVGIVATLALIATNFVHNFTTVACFAPAGQFLDRAPQPVFLS
jgi:hypothetical protein